MGRTDPQSHPRPAPGGAAGPFWEGCRVGALHLQRCDECGRWRFPPGPRCPRCRSASTTWARASGRGRLASYTVCHPPVLPAFTDAAPYNVVVVELDEGPFLVSNLLDAPESPSLGAPVAVTFVAVDEELTLPQFRLV